MANWSPDGESVVFTEAYPYSVYRVDLASPTYCGNDLEYPEGPDLIKIADPDGGFIVPGNSPLYGDWSWLELPGIHYEGLRPGVRWSPSETRNEIAIALETFLANGQQVGIIAVADPSGFNENLVPIYAQYGAVVDYPVWNADGTKLAFILSPYGDTETEVLTIIDRDYPVVDPAMQWTPEDIGLPDGRFAWIDWAKSNPLSLEFAFGSYFQIKKNRGEWRVMVVDLETPDAAEDIAVGRTPSWSPDGEFIVYAHNGRQFTDNEVRSIQLSTRTVTTLANGSTFGDSPDWSRELAPADCTVMGCDDGNPCTDDFCIASVCNYEPVDDGLTRDGCDGACWDGNCEVVCGQKGDACTSNSDCCSNNCRGGKCK